MDKRIPSSMNGPSPRTILVRTVKRRAILITMERIVRTPLTIRVVTSGSETDGASKIVCSCLAERWGEMEMGGRKQEIMWDINS